MRGAEPAECMRELENSFITARRADVLAVATALLVGCSSGPPVETAVVPEPMIVPAGVDSSVAAYADSVADLSFVDISRQEDAAELRREGRTMLERSDSLWLALERSSDSLSSVSPEDSLMALDAASEGGTALVELDRLLRESDLEGEALAAQTALLLDSAETALERAFQLNPFDSRSKLWLSRVYELQARRLGQMEAYEKAVRELEKLVLLTPDLHSTFAMLANNYFRLEQWESAAFNYGRAEEVYLDTYDLVVGQPRALDSAQVFTYVRAQADMRVRSHEAEVAAETFDRALRYALTADDSAYVAGELEWMAWDDMNITSSVTRDSLAEIEQAGDLATARKGYAELLPELSAQSAVDEIEWRLAIVDYNLGSTEAAAARLQELVRRTEKDENGVPVDSNYVQYIDDYGALCLNIGRNFLHEERDNRTALKYFTQATSLVWEGRAVAYLEIATLLQGNVETALANASLALEGEANLTVDQRGSLYRILMGLYRRSGDFDRARQYRDAYRSLQEP